MATLSELRITISTVIQNPIYMDSMLDTRINDAVSTIAAGIQMPNGCVSPPLPALYLSGTVSTATDAAYASLPATYQRDVFLVLDGDADKINPIYTYYSFKLFLDTIGEKDLSESGSITHVAIKGSNLYYQGIPTASEDLTVHFYRKPVDMSEDDDTPDGIPEHLQTRLIMHYVCRDIFGENIKGDPVAPGKATYHDIQFYKVMQELEDFIGEDPEPVYYGGN